MDEMKQYGSHVVAVVSWVAKYVIKKIKTRHFFIFLLKKNNKTFKLFLGPTKFERNKKQSYVILSVTNRGINRQLQ